MREREDEWTGLMRSAIAGDSGAYHRLLKAVTPVLRAAARRGLARAGQPADQSEDIVQDILLAVHLKRHTWDANAPFAPWLFAIARNKLIDSLRRRGRRVFVNIDDFAETIPSEPAAETAPASEEALRRLFEVLDGEDLEVLPRIGIQKRKRVPSGPTETLVTVKARRGQNYFREAVINNGGGCCGVTGLAVRDLLIASHILPWGTHPEHRLNVRNGICLSRLHDAAFDRGLITFDDSLQLI